MYEGEYKRLARLSASNRGYGVALTPEPIYEFPEGHPCRGCPFTFQTSKPSCMTGKYPDTENCAYAFYKKIQHRRSAERTAVSISEEGANVLWLCQR